MRRRKLRLRSVGMRLRKKRSSARRRRNNYAVGLINAHVLRGRTAACPRFESFFMSIACKIQRLSSWFGGNCGLPFDMRAVVIAVHASNVRCYSTHGKVTSTLRTRSTLDSSGRTWTPGRQRTARSKPPLRNAFDTRQSTLRRARYRTRSSQYYRNNERRQTR